MTFWVKNISAGPLSLALNGAQAVSAGSSVDLEAPLDGEPANRRTAILGSTELSRGVLVDGDWQLLEDDGVTPVSDPTSRLSAAEETQLDARAFTLEKFSVVAAVNTEVALRTWTVPSGKRLSVCAGQLDIDADDDGSTPRGGVYSGLGKAGRVGAGSAVLIGSTMSGAENMSADRVYFDVSGNDLRLMFRSRYAGTLNITLRYLETESDPA